MGTSTFLLTENEKTEIDRAAKMRSTFLRHPLTTEIQLECDIFLKYHRRGGGKARKRKLNQAVGLFRAALTDYMNRRL